MNQKTLTQIVSEKPYPDYAAWWPMGADFLTFMSQAIYSQWVDLPHNPGDLRPVKDYVSTYLQVVYSRAARETLVDEFVKQENLNAIQSGEFDALSYAFFRSAFELIADHPESYDYALERERRSFTQRVGKIFFGQLNNTIKLDLPDTLKTEADFERLRGCVGKVGAFLQAQGYLRDHFAFRFDLELGHQGRRIVQTRDSFLDNLQHSRVAYALYEMGYPVILPSAVYLYHTLGEAQHHSSRTIEELFALVGYEARETDDFDPIGYPADLVVELWEIRKLK